ncbi:hypothetical protein GDO81_013540 [Engystomops pustulosus]|uniref:Uncharacterized protein n=1 Tax=Engystomops pustulosus TaxID=76066 RepID=A0AAV7B0A5_ENGPU|nr:hypothetical protein GDO81_013540 [Engystomops pustulosus]
MLQGSSITSCNVHMDVRSRQVSSGVCSLPSYTLQLWRRYLSDYTSHYRYGCFMLHGSFIYLLV